MNPKPKLLEIFLDQNWEFRRVGEEQWRAVSVPGSVHTDLLAHGLIPDPYHRLAECELQWIENTDWEYQCYVDHPFGEKNNDPIYLSFKGLDTYVSVFLNGQLILEADNMFKAWDLPVHELLKPKQNHLYLYFHAAVKKGLTRMEAYEYLVPAHNEQTFLHQRTSVHTRKAPYHFGWDWGPRLVGAGIWRPVSLVTWQKARITEVCLQIQSITAEKARYQLAVESEFEQAETYQLRLFLSDELQNEYAFAVESGKKKVQLPLHIERPRLWWPKGWGEAHLYELKVQLWQDDVLLDEQKQRFGVRTLALIQEPDDEGRSFYFQVNGKALFIKGANYIPGDFFNHRVGEEQYQEAVSAARDANMNMLRVWGGAVYEDDRFYELCDENGILVWQDFMFACAMNPGDEAFLQSVAEEAEYNIKRLRHHPCLALWCGNNENLNGWHEWEWPQIYRLRPEDEMDLWQGYHRLFHEILPALVRQYDPERAYWPTSPAAGINLLSNAQSGDEHDWRVWFQSAPFADYQRETARFVSEYGFQSFPERKSMAGFSQPEDWQVDLRTAVLAHRQRSRIGARGVDFDGNDQILDYARKYYPAPRDFDSLLHISQMLQALALKYAIEGHRSQKPRTMGSMYWQINDCWPTISWSTMDYYGRWKAAHFLVKRAYAEKVLLFRERGKELFLYANTDGLDPVSMRGSWRLMTFDGEILWQAEFANTLQSNENRLLDSVEKNVLLAGKKEAELVLFAEAETDQGETIQNHFFFCSPLKMKLSLPRINIQCKRKKEVIHLTLETDTLVKDLWLDWAEIAGRFTDNAFDLLPKMPYRLQFVPKEEISFSESELEAKLKIRSLLDSAQPMP
jgi:beta-mannosidase